MTEHQHHLPEPTALTLGQIADLAAELAARGERERRLPAPLVAAMRDADLFRLCVPADVGGGEAHPRELIETVEALARGDGAAGWCLAVQATTGLLAGYLDTPSAREIFGTAGGVAGGVFAPRGRADVDGDTLTVSGRWAFASGCDHADWLCGGCVVHDGDSARMLANGMPDIALVLARAADVQVHDTWDVSGLRATGSHDIEFSDLRAPQGHSVAVFSAAPLAEGALYCFPLFGLLAIAIGAVSLGIARGALDDLTALAGGKTPQGGTRRLADRATVQAEVAQAHARLGAARALLLEATGSAYAAAESSRSVPVAARTELRIAATHAASTGAAVTESAYRLGGGSSIYASSPLQRRFRDAHVATQHMLVSPSTWELTGRLLLGVETDTTQL